MDRYALQDRNQKFSGLKRTYTQTEQLDRNSNAIFGRIFTFEVPREYTGLTNINIRATLTTAGDNSSIASYLGARIFKYIELRTKRGEVIGRQYPETAYARIDELTSTPLGSNYTNMVEPDASFNNATVNVGVPLFFWFQEKPEHRLPIRDMEEVELYCEVQDSFTAMGLDVTLTSATYECIFDFYEEPDEPKAVGKEFLAYDVFREKQLSVGASDTTQKFLLKCPFPVYMSVFKVNTDDLQTEGEVTKIVMNTLGRTWLEKYRRLNFNTYDPIMNNTINTGSVFAYSYPLEPVNRKKLGEIKDVIAFNTSMKPTYVTLTHDTIGATGTGTVFHEYLTKVKYEESNGKLMISIKNDGFFDIY